MARRVSYPLGTPSAPEIAEKIQPDGSSLAIDLAKPCIRFRVSKRFDADALFLPPPI
jgi:hypothetical protein